MEYKEGNFETKKFSARKGPYYESLSEILSLGYSAEDLIHHFPSFVGHMTVSRFLALYCAANGRRVKAALRASLRDGFASLDPAPVRFGSRL